MKNEVTFPIYRKYLNDQSYFKIKSNSTFDELKKEPGGFKIYSVEAKILPDRNFISDMIYDFENHWEEISEEEYTLMLASV